MLLRNSSSSWNLSIFFYNPQQHFFFTLHPSFSVYSTIMVNHLFLTSVPFRPRHPLSDARAHSVYVLTHFLLLVHQLCPPGQSPSFKCHWQMTPALRWLVSVASVCTYSCLHWTNKKLSDILALSPALAVILVAKVVVVAVETHRDTTPLPSQFHSIRSGSYNQFSSAARFELSILCVPLCVCFISSLADKPLFPTFPQCCFVCALFTFRQLVIVRCFCLPFATDLLCLQISLFVISLTHTHTPLLHRQLIPNAELYSLRCQWLPAGDYLVLLGFCLFFIPRLFSKCVHFLFSFLTLLP